jgi:hypothetical protein
MQNEGNPETFAILIGGMAVAYTFFVKIAEISGPKKGCRTINKIC